MSQLLQFAGSLAAILVLVWLARQLGLGSATSIRDEDHARALADEVICGFDAAEIVVDRSGTGALLRDRQGRVMVLRRHGAHFAGRLLEGDIDTRHDESLLTLATSDKRFGNVTLDLGQDAQLWATSLRRSGG